MPVSDLVTKKLLHLLMSGEFNSGDKLPSADFLAREVGVSILTARESIKNMEMVGLVEVLHGKGIYATKGKMLIDDFFEAREFFECNNVVAAVKMADEQDCDEIDRQLRKMAKQIQTGDLNGYIQSHFEFHKSISIYTKNRILIKSFDNLQKLVLFHMEILNRYPGVPQRSFPEHITIFEHIKNKESDLAKKAMENHIRKAHTTWKKYIAIDSYKTFI